MISGSWETGCNKTIFLFHFGPILPFYSNNGLKNQVWKNARRYYFTPEWQKSWYDWCTVPEIQSVTDRWSTVTEIWSVMDWSWQMWVIFCPFTPLKTQKIRILKKRRKLLRISSFYTCVPKIMIIWIKVFKNGPSKICRRQHLKNMKWYGLLRQAISLQIFKGCLPKILIGPFLNNLTHMMYGS